MGLIAKITEQLIHIHYALLAPQPDNNMGGEVGEVLIRVRKMDDLNCGNIGGISFHGKMQRSWKEST